MSTKDTVFAIDLHGVLFKHDRRKMLFSILGTHNKYNLLRAVLSISLWKDVIKLSKKQATAEEYLVGLADHHPRLKPFVPLFVQTANLQIVQHDVLNLLQQWRAMNYKLYIFSNIGGIIFDDLKNRHPFLLELFDNYTVSSKESDYTRKPSKEAFQRFIDQNDLSNKKIIFVDDKPRNINAALQYGICGILFSNASSLKQEVKKLTKP